jgi:hypothetical protein
MSVTMSIWVHAMLATAITTALITLQTPARSVSFRSVDYIHRWSQAGQHEFTPQGDEDLSKWNAMVTINVHENVRDGEQLAQLADGVVANYQKVGKILRTDSKPRTAKSEAEHMIAAVLGTPQFLEAVFARILMHDSRGAVVVYSKRVYGAKAGNEMSAWLEKNGPDTERALMAWTAIPTREWLKTLPQTK